MDTLFRSLVMIAVAVWLGGLFFFPFVAQIAFSAQPGQQAAAGLIVGTCLMTLHELGLACGALLLILLTAAHMRRAVRRTLVPAFTLLILMMGTTAISQFSVVPRMEAYRIAAGGSINLVPPSDPNRVAFERLHQNSVSLEAGVLLAGLLLVVALAWVDSGGPILRRVRRMPGMPAPMAGHG